MREDRDCGVGRRRWRYKAFVLHSQKMLRGKGIRGLKRRDQSYTSVERDFPLGLAPRETERGEGIIENTAWKSRDSA